jgi:hypothetical protein
LDALPADVLRNRIHSEVESRMDLHALNSVKSMEAADQRRLESLLEGAA